MCRFKDFDVEKDCPKLKKSYDNDCYDCYYYDCCLGKIEKVTGW